MNNYKEFEGKVALVTGAAQGIGAEIVKQLQHSHAQVAQIDKAWQSDFQNLQFNVDITDVHAVESAVRTIESELGAIDYVVSVAGILKTAHLIECSTEDWLDTFAVNTHGPFFLCRAVAKFMRERGRGAIVAVSSNAAHIPRIGMGAYPASKAALTQMMKCLALELAESNVRCNVVSPGSTDTDMQRQLWSNEDGAKKIIAGSLEHYRTGIPLQRIASPELIANVVLFLLSDKAQHITMENITVDGGATLGAG